MVYYHIMSLDPQFLDFLHSSEDPTHLNKSSTKIVKCVCLTCHNVYERSFRAVYDRRRTTGKTWHCRSCAKIGLVYSKSTKSRRQPPAPQFTDFLDPSYDVAQLWKTSGAIVPCVCSSCGQVKHRVFAAIYKRRQRTGQPYQCKSCAKTGHKYTDNQRANMKVAQQKRFANGERSPLLGVPKSPETRQKLSESNKRRLADPEFRAQTVARIQTVNQQRWYTDRDPAVLAKLNDIEWLAEQQQTRTLQNIAKEIGVWPETVKSRLDAANIPIIYHTARYGKSENEVRAFLETTTNSPWRSTWSIIAPLQLDGFSSDHNMAFEYCGLRWHSEARGKDRFYHYTKLLRCREQNIRLYTIFEDEWIQRQAQVQDVLRAGLGIFDVRIGARQTTCQVIHAKYAAEFVTAHHIQPMSKPPRIAWGLFDKSDRLVSVMAFGDHHRQGHDTKKQVVLTRFVSLPGYQVVGGASKLLSTAKTVLATQYDSILSWSDNRWSEGNVYKQLGFQYGGELAPDYSYVGRSDINASNGLIRRAKQSCTRALLNAAPGQTEKDRATELGLSRIWDCGKQRWVLDL